MVSIVSTAPIEVVCINYPCLERFKGGFENILVLTEKPKLRLCMRISLFTVDSQQ